ncbi:MAG: DUF721 domain-containing protein [Propionibacteriaceae bacterium]
MSELPPDPGDIPPARDPAADASPPEHVPEGLDLARIMARAVSGSTRAVRWRKARRADPVPPRSSGAHPDDRDPQTLSHAMNRLVESRGWSTEVNVATVLGRWPALVGPMNAQHVTPVGYADGVLTVQADATVWASSIRAMAPQLVAKLNEALGDGTVTRVTVLGPIIPSWKKGRRSVRDGRGPRDTYG